MATAVAATTTTTSSNSIDITKDNSHTDSLSLLETKKSSSSQKENSLKRNNLEPQQEKQHQTSTPQEQQNPPQDRGDDDDVLLYIFRFFVSSNQNICDTTGTIIVDGNTLRTIMLVCKRWYMLVTSSSLWMTHSHTGKIPAHGHNTNNKGIRKCLSSPLTRSSPYSSILSSSSVQKIPKAIQTIRRPIIDPSLNIIEEVTTIAKSTSLSSKSSASSPIATGNDTDTNAASTAANSFVMTHTVDANTRRAPLGDHNYIPASNNGAASTTAPNTTSTTCRSAISSSTTTRTNNKNQKRHSVSHVHSLVGFVNLGRIQRSSCICRMQSRQPLQPKQQITKNTNNIDNDALLFSAYERSSRKRCIISISKNKLKTPALLQEIFVGHFLYGNSFLKTSIADIQTSETKPWRQQQKQQSQEQQKLGIPCGIKIWNKRVIRWYDDEGGKAVLPLVTNKDCATVDESGGKRDSSTSAIATSSSSLSSSEISLAFSLLSSSSPSSSLPLETSLSLISHLKKLESEFCATTCGSTPDDNSRLTTLTTHNIHTSSTVRRVPARPLIRMDFRATLVDWIFEIVECFDLEVKIAYRAMEYFDRFFLNCTLKICKKMHQLLASACLHIAIKLYDDNTSSRNTSYDENDATHIEGNSAQSSTSTGNTNSAGNIDINDIILSADNTFNTDQINDCEEMILKILNWKLAHPTLIDYVENYMNILFPSHFDNDNKTNDTSHKSCTVIANQSLIWITHYLSELTLQCPIFYTNNFNNQQGFHSSSKIAACVIVLARFLRYTSTASNNDNGGAGVNIGNEVNTNNGINNDKRNIIWPSELEAASGYTFYELEDCINMIVYYIKQIQLAMPQLVIIKRRYKHRRRGGHVINSIAFSSSFATLLRSFNRFSIGGTNSNTTTASSNANSFFSVLSSLYQEQQQIQQQQQ